VLETTGDVDGVSAPPMLEQVEMLVSYSRCTVLDLRGCCSSPRGLDVPVTGHRRPAARGHRS
jgi:hypothetical protein